MDSSHQLPGAVAGFVDPEGRFADIFDAGAIRVYARESMSWILVREFSFRFAADQGLRPMRDQVRTLVEQLGRCPILFVGKIRGVLPALLGEQGIAVAVQTGDAQAALDRWALEESPAAEDSLESETNIEPTELAPGILRLDLVSTMSAHPRLTSRQILLPLLSQRVFTLFEILCDHPPRWLDTDGRRLGFGYESVPWNDRDRGFLVTLFHDESPIGESSEPENCTVDGCFQGCPSSKRTPISCTEELFS